MGREREIKRYTEIVREKDRTRERKGREPTHTYFTLNCRVYDFFLDSLCISRTSHLHTVKKDTVPPIFDMWEKWTTKKSHRNGGCDRECESSAEKETQRQR